jgi:hypothetical protein
VTVQCGCYRKRLQCHRRRYHSRSSRSVRFAPIELSQSVNARSSIADNFQCLVDAISISNASQTKNFHIFSFNLINCRKVTIAGHQITRYGAGTQHYSKTTCLKLASYCTRILLQRKTGIPLGLRLDVGLASERQTRLITISPLF